MRKLVTAAVGGGSVVRDDGFCANTPTATPPVTASTEHIMWLMREAEMLHRALMEGRHDPATLQLLDQALTDRTTLLQAELDRVAKAQALVTAIQGGDRAASRRPGRP